MYGLCQKLQCLNDWNANVWFLRVYESKEPVSLTRSRDIVFANTDQKVELDYEDSIIGHGVFEKLKEEVLNK